MSDKALVDLARWRETRDHPPIGPSGFGRWPERAEPTVYHYTDFVEPSSLTGGDSVGTGAVAAWSSADIAGFARLQCSAGQNLFWSPPKADVKIVQGGFIVGQWVIRRISGDNSQEFVVGYKTRAQAPFAVAGHSIVVRGRLDGQAWSFQVWQAGVATYSVNLNPHIQPLTTELIIALEVVADARRPGFGSLCWWVNGALLHTSPTIALPTTRLLAFVGLNTAPATAELAWDAFAEAFSRYVAVMSDAQTSSVGGGSGGSGGGIDRPGSGETPAT